jgi:tetratricopeptide (TPR) repeat protein
MADNSRIDALRRRVQTDPASIAFAQLAEECRRAGEHQEAVDVCRAGLAIHPGYASARVTLGRALIELGQLDEAQTELSRVLESAPDNLAAIRGLAVIHRRRGDLSQALAFYRDALELAPHDPDLERTIADLSKPAPPQSTEPPRAVSPPVVLAAATPPTAGAPHPDTGISTFNVVAEPANLIAEAASLVVEPPPQPEDRQVPPERPSSNIVEARPSASPSAGGTLLPGADDRAARTLAALEQWLAAVHVARSHPRP